MINIKSQEVFDKACNYMPGGVNSPVRAFGSVGLKPPVIKKGKGSRLFDLDENEYIDYVCSWGPMILGHAQPDVIAAIREAAENGTSFGAPTENELQLAELICDAVPSMEMLRLVSSGTEAAMSAIRAARGYTGRDLIVKFEGCYHGHSDGLLVKAGSGALTAGVPDSSGVPEGYSRNTLVAVYNDPEGLQELFKKYGSSIAAVIIEPIAANMGLVLPDIDFLKQLRTLTENHGALLIFDEVITGFRVSYGGAQELYGIKPDLTVLGKIIGGGMPVGAYGGRREIMERIAPLGPVYQAGTLSGNPVAVAAGISTLKTIKHTGDFYQRLDCLGKSLENAYNEAAGKYRIDIRINRVGSLLSVFFSDREVVNYSSAVRSDLDKFKKYFSLMLNKGIYIAPSQFEALFVSYVHTEKDISETKAAIEYAFSQL